MTDYYLKKNADNDVQLTLQCSVASNDTLTVVGLSLYSDSSCQYPVSPAPTIAAGDTFSTSQGICAISFQPGTSGGWTFRARKKGSSTLSNPLTVTGDASTPASFSVVATASGHSDLVLDPSIRFGNSAMQQAGVPTAIMLASAYLDPPLFGAHGLLVVLPFGFHADPGRLVFDPNPHPLDEWGNPVGPSLYRKREHEIAALTRVRDEDDGMRILDRLECRDLPDAEVFLARDEAADRWTLIYAPAAGGRFVVPLFRS